MAPLPNESDLIATVFGISSLSWAISDHTTNGVTSAWLVAPGAVQQSRVGSRCRAAPIAIRGWWTRRLQERLAAGDQWTDTGVVFATEFGTIVEPAEPAAHSGDGRDEGGN